jgi:CheY-like chemotaxis protein
MVSPTSALHRRILVIEDNPFQRASLAHSLTELGLEVLTAEHPFEALDGARLCRPDAIICDALAQDLDGFELCLVIRQDRQIAHLPVILTSAGRVAEVDTYVARKVGCNALVQRQADSAEVIEALVACLHEGLKRLPVTETIPIHFASYNHGFDAE